MFSCMNSLPKIESHPDIKTRHRKKPSSFIITFKVPTLQTASPLPKLSLLYSHKAKKYRSSSSSPPRINFHRSNQIPYRIILHTILPVKGVR